MVGQTISRYRVLEKLGEGGMGAVYKAEDTKLRRTVALKFLRGDEPEHRERFLREAQAAAGLSHPNICTVYEVDEENGFLAIELVEGLSLKDKIAAHPLPLEEALGIAVQISHGLEAAHEKGIVHRDIKPANILLTSKGQVKITDFGLATLSDRTRITKSGVALGHARIHVAGTGARKPDRSKDRHLVAGSGFVRDGERTSAIPRRERSSGGAGHS